MQQRFLLSFALLATLVFGLSYSTNPPNGKTGAPGEGTCNECHTGSNPALDGDITITGLPANVDPNTTYTVTITLTNPNGVAVRGGFQWVSLNSSNTNAGDISNPSTGSATMTTAGREYHEHSGSNFFGTDPLVWTADWTAPSGPTGEVITFYSIGNIANGSGSTNDRIKLATASTTLNASMLPLSAEIIDFIDVTCFDGSDGLAAVTVEGGSPNYTYLWSNGENGNPAFNLSAGIASVTVTDSVGDTATASVTINQPTELLIDMVDADLDICVNANNGYVETEASGGSPGYTYSWSNGSTNSFIAQVPAGMYTLTVEDSAGCSAVASYTVVEQALTVAISGSTTFCEGQSTDLTATGGYQIYSWSSGDLGQTATVSDPGFVTVVVTDVNGCTGSSSVLVSALPAPVGTIQGPAEICPGIESTLTVSSTFAAYAWSTGDVTQSTIIDDCAIYTVTVSDMNGCTAVFSKTVTCVDPIEIVLISNTPVSCNGGADGSLEAAPGNPNGVTVVWSNGEPTGLIEDLTPGDYTFFATNALGCTYSETYTVVQPDTMSLVIDSLVLPICSADTTSLLMVSVLGGNPPFSYFWSTGIQGDSITVFGSGSYAVTVVDSKSCVDSFDVVIPDVPVLSILLDTLVNNDCFGDENGMVSILAVGGQGDPITYQWSNGSMSTIISNLAAGTYSVTATDSVGCTAAKTYTIQQAAQLLITGNAMNESQAGLNDGSISTSIVGGTPDYDYLWSTGAITPAITGLMPGTYSLTVTDANACTATQQFTVSAANCNFFLSGSSTNVTCNGDNDGSISLIPANGLEPYTFNIPLDELNQLSAGSYTIIASDSGGCITDTTIIITQPELLVANIEIVNLATCLDIQDATIQVSTEGGSGEMAILWSNGSTEAEQNVSSGTYTVTVTDGNQCAASADITVGFEDNIAPSIVLQSVTVYVDEAGNIDLPLASAYDNGSSDNCTNLTFDYSQIPLVECFSATYLVDIIATDEYNNVATETTELIVLDTIAPQIVCSPDIMTNSCGPTEYSVLAVDNCATTSLTLLEGLESGSIFPEGTTQVTYQVADQSGNVSECSFAVIVAYDLEVGYEITNVSCFGESDGSIELFLSGGTAPYTINPEDLSNLGAGTYTVSLTDAAGCMADITFDITEPPLLELTLDEVVNESILGQNDGSIATTVSGGSGNYVFQWFYNTASILLDQEDETNLAPGLYDIIVIDGNGCQATLKDIVVEPGVVSSTAEVTAQQVSFKMVPNPAQTSIGCMIAEDVELWRLEIYDLRGRLMLAPIRTQFQNISIETLDQGIYLSKVVTDKGTFTVKWLKI